MFIGYICTTFVYIVLMGLLNLLQTVMKWIKTWILQNTDDSDHENGKWM